ncbi:ATP-binding cassette domain-containing protein [Variovorax sp. E3]|uniref:ABC transporter ATP-binding protein n=1 Tax=Variovorax sp. E3 TaxID=1914993 RepID=UPI0018DB0A6D
MLLEVKDLSVHYDGMQALAGVSLHVRQGEIVSILGSNGAGKTTFMNAMSGLLKLTSGHVEFEGKSVLGVPAYERVPLGIVQIPEGRRLFPLMTVEENLLLGSTHPAARKVRKESLEEAYQLLPRLRERRTQIAKTLSGGEQQMVAIARAMQSKPKLLMFDEPSLGLSPLLVQELFDLIKKLNDRGITILMVEQNVRKTLQIVDRSYVLENGHIVMEGTGKDLLNDESIRKAFLGM